MKHFPFAFFIALITMHSHISPFLQNSFFSSHPFSSLKGKLLLKQHNSLTPPTPLCFFESWHAQFVTDQKQKVDHMEYSYPLFLSFHLSPHLSPLLSLPSTSFQMRRLTGLLGICVRHEQVFTQSRVWYGCLLLFMQILTIFLNVTWKNGEIHGQRKWEGIPSCVTAKTQKNPKHTIWKRLWIRV